MKDEEQKVAMRVDASSRIGTGHLMRCLTLADELRAHGVHTRFISRHMPEHLQRKLAERGHEFVLFEALQNDTVQDELVHAPWLGVSQPQDAAASIQALSDQKWDWLIVDHYALDMRWESLLRQSADKILVIDDIADRRHDCDILLDQNLYADMRPRYAGKVPAHCQLLLGPNYALLRDEFGLLHGQVKPRSGPAKRVLVFFGGVDADNYTGQAIKALAQIDVSHLHVDVVIGAQHPLRKQIEAECTRQEFNCHVQTDKMAELMAAADLAIGAGGAATWERCCLGLPALVICTAENQKQQVQDAARQGLLYLPEATDDLIQLIKKHALVLIENSSLRYFISDNGMRTVDGRGISRVFANMWCSDVEMKMATPDDSRNLFNWRNHPSIRATSRNSDLIAWQDHQKWLTSILTDSKKWLLIGEEAGVPIGVVRFDAQNDEAEVSIYLIPEKVSSGLGQTLLRSAERWLSTNHPEIRKVRAHVLGSNERSLRFFSKAGYQIESADFSKRLH